MAERSRTRPRSPLFRALGRHDPPAAIHIGSQLYRLQELFKHDSWAATALYVCRNNDREAAVCKFHRIVPLFGLSLHRFGIWMAEHERRLLACLAGLPGIPRLLPKVTDLDGRPLPHAVAREYIPGCPLRAGLVLDPAFFSSLRQTLLEMHRRGIAYVDLHKRENIIVGRDGRPYLVDFQIGFSRQDYPRPTSPLLQRTIQHLADRLFILLSQTDLYHLEKHIRRAKKQRGPRIPPPRWIGWHRRFAAPLRQLRRRLLVWCGIRSGRGAAGTELFAEDAFRC